MVERTPVCACTFYLKQHKLRCSPRGSCAPAMCTLRCVRCVCVSLVSENAWVAARCSGGSARGANRKPLGAFIRALSRYTNLSIYLLPRLYVEVGTWLSTFAQLLVRPGHATSAIDGRVVREGAAHQYRADIRRDVTQRCVPIDTSLQPRQVNKRNAVHCSRAPSIHLSQSSQDISGSGTC